MGKKRKASNGIPRLPSPERSAKLALNSWEDVADEQDEFLLNREKILLDEGAAAKRQRKNDEEYAALGSNEVQILHLPDSDLSDEYEDNDDDNLDYDDEYENEDLEQLSKAAASARAHASKIQVSDDVEDEGDYDSWGGARKDYYGADELETEQAALEEEIEAKKIQSKRLENLTDADYGLDIESWSAPETSVLSNGKPTHNVIETLPDVVIPENATESELNKILRERYPEFTALSKEFTNLQPEHDRLRNLVVKQKVTNALIITKYWVLATYLASLAMYFAILTEKSKDVSDGLAKAPAELQDHPVMKMLVSYKISWEKAKNAKEESDTMEEEATEQAIDQVVDQVITNGHINGINPPKQTADKARRKDNQKPSHESSASSIRRAARATATEDDLAAFTTSITSRATHPTHPAPTSSKPTKPDLGDDTDLTAHEAAEKAQRRRNLRFYTSQLAQRSAKRAAASAAQGGDMDVPHRERWKDRQARWAAEAEARRASDGGGGGGYGRDGREALGDGRDGDEGYEDLVRRSKSLKEQAKRQKRDAWEDKRKEDSGAWQEEVIGEDGKRKITYHIEKNKGLTQNRKKSIRNSRVKKRLKYEDKKKKLGSTKAIYKGGPGPAGYQGELTGIKKNLVKSTKL